MVFLLQCSHPFSHSLTLDKTSGIFSLIQRSATPPSEEVSSLRQDDSPSFHSEGRNEQETPGHNMKQIWFFKILINLFFFFNNLDDELILFLCLEELVSTLISPIGSLISLFPCFIYIFILLFTFLPPDTPPPHPRRCQHSVLEVTLFQALWKGFVVVMNACFKITHVLQDVASAALGSALL